MNESFGSRFTVLAIRTLTPMLLTNQSTWLRRAWHAVLHSDELDDGSPLAVWVLGEPWVLVRLSGGVRAFRDRCPHRSLPLSAGSIVDGGLQCAYHGWRFDGDGACTAIPALGTDASIPTRAHLDAPFAVLERYGLIWLAPDEPIAPLPELPELDDPGFERVFATTVRTEVGAGQLVDNFMDAAHFPFVHAETFGVPESAEVHDSGVERTATSVRSVFEAPYRNFDDPLVATGEHDLVQSHHVEKIGMASLTVGLRLTFPVTGAVFAILYSCQPERDGSTRIFKAMARNDFHDRPGEWDRLVAEEDTVLREDLAILERYRSRTVDLDPRHELHTRADRLSVAWRRLMADMAESEKEKSEMEHAAFLDDGGARTSVPSERPVSCR